MWRMMLMTMLTMLRWFFACERPLVDDEPSGLTDQDSDDDEEHEEVETD